MPLRSPSGRAGCSLLGARLLKQREVRALRRPERSPKPRPVAWRAHPARTSFLLDVFPYVTMSVVAILGKVLWISRAAFEMKCSIVYWIYWSEAGSQNRTGFKCTTRWNIVCSLHCAPITQSAVSFQHTSSLLAHLHLPYPSFPKIGLCINLNEVFSICNREESYNAYFLSVK